MITDKQMISLGFEKGKNYGKITNGISKIGWYKHNFFLSRERDDNTDSFQPTLRIDNCIWSFTDIEELKQVLKSLKII